MWKRLKEAKDYIKTIINNIYLCIKYPFLYPRNRFNGLHYNNWTIVDKINKIKDNSYIYLNIIVSDDFDNPTSCIKQLYSQQANIKYSDSVYINNYPLYITRDEKTNYFCVKDKNNKIIHLFKDENYVKNGICERVYFANRHSEKTNFCGVKIVDDKNFIIILTKGEKLKYGEVDNYFLNYHLTIENNKFGKYKIKFLEFIHNTILQWIFCIPTYIELDAMERGWRKAFGLQMCEEIKQELKKYNYLYKYRISQIKEKFGQSRWYDNGSPHGCVYPIIDKYERISEKTCGACGKPAVYQTTGWIYPYCEDCVPKDSNYIKIE